MRSLFLSDGSIWKTYGSE